MEVAIQLMFGPGCAEVAAATIDTLIVTEIHKNFYIKYNIRKIIIIEKYKINQIILTKS